MARLSKANQHIRTKAARAKLVVRAVVSSSAAEGVKIKPEDLGTQAKPKR